jgi:predicted MFS family arabinose efflux permease
MAVATGAIVANLYYAQPLLHQIAKSFSVGSAATSLVVTATQVGYAAGLVTVVPLGDLHPRRILVMVVFLVAAGGLVVCATAPSLWLFEVASAATGAASVAGQIMVPFAADLASPERRGRVVARVMTGLLLGILLARTLSGIVAQLAGWRAIYWLSAGMMVVFAFVLRAVLPPEQAERERVPYFQLVSSALRLLVDYPALRRRGWYGATCFAGFSVLWTSLAFVLSAPPYDYSNLVIGLFGLAGVAGVGAANVAGRLADGDRRRPATLVAAVLVAVSFALLAGGRRELALLVLGIVVLDAGVQGMQIVNQSVIYELVPAARSRVNSAYMTCYFAGGAIGSFATGFVYAAGGWGAVCGLGAGFGVLALAMTAFDKLWPAGSAARNRSDHLPAVSALGVTSPMPSGWAGLTPGLPQHERSSPDVGPGNPRRRADRRDGRPPPKGRRRDRRWPHRGGGRRRSGRTRDRRHGPDRVARVRRRALPRGRPGVLGRWPHPLFAARDDHHVRREHRLHHRPARGRQG